MLEGEVLRVFEQALNEVVSEAGFERSMFVQSDLVGLDDDRGNQENWCGPGPNTKRWRCELFVNLVNLDPVCGRFVELLLDCLPGFGECGVVRLGERPGVSYVAM